MAIIVDDLCESLMIQAHRVAIDTNDLTIIFVGEQLLCKMMPGEAGGSKNKCSLQLPARRRWWLGSLGLLGLLQVSKVLMMNRPALF